MIEALDWEKRKNIFLEACELDPAVRERFLEAACGPDTTLLHDVRDMLAADTPDVDDAELWAPAAQPRLAEGQQLGVYRIVRTLGRGGHGEVYLARRTDGTYETEVAIKLVRSQMDGAQLAARFRRERRILAALDHPGIARILDAGSTGEGVPYLVMDYVDGVPIDEYCERNRLPVSRRVELFLDVCAAVRYVHGKLIVHRDLKPGNILVTQAGQPKLLDFGTARLLDTEALSGERLTRTWMRVMTPEYASPEQFRGEPVSTQTDVYALGTILFRLLTGLMPFDFGGQTWAQAMLTVCGEAPPAPSAAVAAGDTKLRRELRGDLDNIVLKALRKEPGNRYASVESMESDLRRHLQGLPVLARDASVLYRARKLAWRYRWAVGAVLLIFLSLAGGLAATMWQARRADRERQMAEERFRDLRGIAHSFIFDFHDGIRDMPGAIPLRQLFVTKATAYLNELSKQNANDESLQLELAEGYNRVGDVFCSPDHPNLGEPSEAISAYKRAERILTDLQGVSKSPRVQLALSETLIRLGVVHSTPQCRTEPPVARPAVEHAAALFASLRGKLSEDDRDRAEADLDNAWGMLLLLRPPESSANPWFQKEVRIRDRILARRPDDDEARFALGIAWNGMATASTGSQSISASRASLAIVGPLYEKSPSNQAYAFSAGRIRYGLAWAEVEAGEPAEADAQAAVSIFSRMVERDPANMQARKMAQRSYRILSKVYQARGDFAHADELRIKGVAFVSDVDHMPPSPVRELNGRKGCPSGEPPQPFRSADSSPLLQPGKLLITDLDTKALVVVDTATGAQMKLAEGGFLVQPIRSAIDSRGDVMVATALPLSAQGGVVRLHFESVARKWTQSVVSCAGFFRDPEGIEFDRAGGLVVADEDGFNNFHGRIIRVDPVTGRQTLLAQGGPLAQIQEVLRLDPTHFLFTNMWSTSGGPAAVLSLDLKSGKLSTVSQLGRLEDPAGLSPGPNGTVFVDDADSVYDIDLATGAQRIFFRGGLLGRPGGMARIGQTLYVASKGKDGTHPCIVAIDIPTRRQRLLTERGFLVYPNGVAVRPGE